MTELKKGTLLTILFLITSETETFIKVAMKKNPRQAQNISFYKLFFNQHEISLGIQLIFALTSK